MTAIVCSRLGMPSLKCHIFAIPCPKSWQCSIQDLAFQVLKLLRVNKFNIGSMPTILSWLGLPRHEHMPTSLFSGLKSYIFFVQDLACQVLKCYFLQFHAPKSWQFTIQVLAFQVLKLLRVNKFNIGSMPTILSWLGLPRHEHMPTSLFSGLKSYIFFCSRLGLPSFEMLLFCNSMPPSLDNSLFKTWLSKSWNSMDYFLVSMFLLEMCWWFLIVWCVLPVNFQCHFIIVGGLHHMQPWQEEGCFTSLCTSSA